MNSTRFHWDLRPSQAKSEFDLNARLEAAVSSSFQTTSDFDLDREVNPPQYRNFKIAGVVIAISNFETQPNLILTKRCQRLSHHAGQVAFPGGKKEISDADVLAAAFREAYEEIGLLSDCVKVVGALPHHETVTGFRITPVIAIIERPFDIRPEVGEVEEVFKVPFDHILNLSNYHIQTRYWRGTKRVFFAVPFGPYYIWGATACILRGLAERINNETDKW
ncbi:MAG: CoA pyrophosphatase [Aestuariivita sp.]|nr:CoA pyrophosphatase [Aestuariivita sp.]